MQNTFRVREKKENFWHHSNWNYEDEIAIETSLPYYNFDSSLADAPVCTVDKTIIVGAFRSENLNVVCEVHADPPPRSFKWKFNSSGETFELSKERHYKNASRSLLHYTPIMDQDYGTLTCIGQNDVGEQVVPCVFQVVLAGECRFFTYAEELCERVIKTKLSDDMTWLEVNNKMNDNGKFFLINFSNDLSLVSISNSFG